jgi:predicted nucleotidyltransferase
LSLKSEVLSRGLGRMASVNVEIRAANYRRFFVIRKSYICINETLIQHIQTIRRFFAGRPVKKAYLFGSYSRNDADKNSDVDILVELDHSTPIGLQFFTYSDELQNLLKRKVDVVSYEGLSKYVKPFIDKDKVLIYER